jgi:hypothetical protein
MPRLSIITRLAVIWSCRQEQYEQGRPAHINNYMRNDKYGLGKYDSIFALLLFPNLFRQQQSSPISKQLRSARKFITEKYPSPRLTRWCDCYHNRIIRTEITQGCNELVTVIRTMQLACRLLHFTGRKYGIYQLAEMADKVINSLVSQILELVDNQLVLNVRLSNPGGAGKAAYFNS